MENEKLKSTLFPDELIASKIYLIRGEKVMLDTDLSSVYCVETRVLKQAVRRNIDRFPSDFMFELTKEEYEILRSQFVTLKRGQHSKYLPFAFTEQGVAMLSSVLNSQRAILVNIQIIRVFVKMREMVTDTLNLKLDIEQIKKKLTNHDKNIELVFSYLDELMEKQETPKPRKAIGFKNGNE
ncbi:MAG TPA: DNA-binding protein [Marinilabiliales bacterium]|nr:MAG: DNA-binding protein [Bacteroidetes bacterium GWC2_40_13]OFX72496.1 MAG: DNA-binding protein [Bacteroidetes bacterium GWD2_40_43]OFX90580.1 MAG: DNA-binding protein [Bacteroidetes bacterium GWE2_40_63]OFY20942.1 MAG: DNA-binding protein [Bacteroidetes bacterium GWF2_40_13]OFZ26461.1 MAG: DNA-binding protein [Bacteroidetes bacterium RIFOXYC2_FULL_40_12]HAN00725.1 DNA-binding protein [Marinilabiliales bacterium]